MVTGNNNIYIGNHGAGDEFQTIRIGTAQTQTFIAGIANTTVPNDAVVVIDTVTGQLVTASPSSAHYKRDITAMGTQSASRAAASASRAARTARSPMACM